MDASKVRPRGRPRREVAKRMSAAKSTSGSRTHARRRRVLRSDVVAPSSPDSGGSSPKQSNNGHSSPSIWSSTPKVVLTRHDGPGGPGQGTNNGNGIFGNHPIPTPLITPKDTFAEREGGGMRVGKDFQAKVPPMIPKEQQNPQADADKALLIWCPPLEDQLSEERLTQYLNESKHKYNYTGEQALGLLFWHKYDIVKATQDLGNFSPHSDEWTFEDKALFEQAFQYFGKNFDRMKMMLPDKSIPSLIRHYYRWKKTKSKPSSMDKMSKRTADESDDAYPQVPSRSPFMNNFHLNRQATLNLQHASDSDDDITNRTGDNKCCGNCGVPVSELRDEMCNTCYMYWKNTGEYRPLTGPLRREDKQTIGILRNRRAPPKGMYINHDDLCILASATPQAENVTLKGLEAEVYNLKCRLQNEKQAVEILKRSLPAEGLEKFLPKEPVVTGRVNSRWTQEELLLAAQGIRRYGKDFSKIIPILGTKTETHLRSYYATYQKRFNLDALVEEYMKETETEEAEAVDDDTAGPSSAKDLKPSTSKSS